MQRAMVLAVVAVACGGPPPTSVTNHEVKPAGATRVLATDSFVPLDVALIGSPIATRSCMRQPESCYQIQNRSRRLLVDRDVVLVRWHDVAIYATRDETPSVTAFLDGTGPRDFDKLAFAGMVGDLGMQRSTRDDLALIGRDSGIVLDGPEGFYIECFNCSAPAVVTALVSLGVRWSKVRSP